MNKKLNTIIRLLISFSLLGQRKSSLYGIWKTESTYKQIADSDSIFSVENGYNKIIQITKDSIFLFEYPYSMYHKCSYEYKKRGDYLIVDLFFYICLAIFNENV